MSGQKETRLNWTLQLKTKLKYIVLEYDDFKDLNKIKQKIEAF